MNKDILIVGCIWLIAISIYSLPVNEYPFGDVDASTHFTLSDYQGQHDKVIRNLPYYLNVTYGFANNGKLWYPPQFHLMGAILQGIGSDRINSLYLMYVLLSSLGIITSFLLIQRLYGYGPAFLTTSLIFFAKRDILGFIWGLWPERASYSLIPLVLYCLYKSFEDKKYFFPLPFLLATQFFFHPQGAIISITVMAAFSLIMTFKEKKLPFDLKYAFISFIILVILVSPFISYVIGYNQGVTKESFKMQEINSLFKWFPEEVPYIQELGKYNIAYYTWWTFPFLILGLIYLLKNRRKQDLLFLSWFVSFYLLLHLNIIGFGDRTHRFLGAESFLFIPLISLGIFFIIEYISLLLKKDYKHLMAIVLSIGIFVILAIISIPLFHNAYQGQLRMTNDEMKVCEWIDENIPERSHIRLASGPYYTKRKWMQAICFRHMIYDDKTIYGQEAEDAGTENYILIDYSDSPQLIKEQLSNLESFLPTKPIYYSKMVRIYEAPKRIQ